MKTILLIILIIGNLILLGTILFLIFKKQSCKSDKDCGTGKKCVKGSCTKTTTCDSYKDCATGQVCLKGVCVNSSTCKTDKDCTTGQICLKGACVIAPATDNLPVGSIVIWSTSQIPNGWALCDGTNGTPDLRNRYIRCADTINYSLSTTGGSDGVTIQPQHMPNDFSYIQFFTNAYPDTRQGNIMCTTAPGSDADHTDCCEDSYCGNDLPGQNCQNTFADGGTGTPAAINNNPSFIKVPFIMKLRDDSQDFDGIITIWNDKISTIPEGWEFCDRNQSLDLSKKFIRCCNTINEIGTLGGSDTVTITEQNLPNNVYGYIKSGLWGTGDTTCLALVYPSKTSIISNIINTNSITDGKINNLPSYISKPYMIKKGSTIPAGTIVMWNSENIPSGWVKCDTNNITNFSGLFIPCSDGDASGTIYQTNSTITVDDRVNIGKYLPKTLPYTYYNYQIDSSGNFLSPSGAQVSHMFSQGITDGGQYNCYQTGKFCSYTNFTGNARNLPISVVPLYYTLYFIMKT